MSFLGLSRYLFVLRFSKVFHCLDEADACAAWACPSWPGQASRARPAWQGQPGPIMAGHGWPLLATAVHNQHVRLWLAIESRKSGSRKPKIESCKSEPNLKVRLWFSGLTFDVRSISISDVAELVPTVPSRRASSESQASQSGLARPTWPTKPGQAVIARPVLPSWPC